MALKPHRLEFIFGMVLAMAVTILAITTWAAPNLRAIWQHPSRRFTGLTTGFCTDMGTRNTWKNDRPPRMARNRY